MNIKMCKPQLRRPFLSLAVLLVLLTTANIEAKPKHAQQQVDSTIEPPTARHRRETVLDQEYYDENADVIPVLVEPPQHRLEEVWRQQAEQTAADFKAMWQALSDTMQQCFEAFKRLFSDDASNSCDGSVACEAASLYPSNELPWQNDANNL